MSAAPATSPSRLRDGTAASLLDDAERTRIRAKSAQFAPPTAALPDGRRDLVGLSREELTEIMVEIGEKPFRTKQLWHWIYHQGATDFSRMSSIARPCRRSWPSALSSAAPAW